MLSYRVSLYFPKIVRTGTAIIKWENGNEKEMGQYISKEMGQYILDWSWQEEKLKQSHDKWIENCHPDKRDKLPHVISLPEKYDTWVKSLKFAINDKYMQEIKRNTRRAMEEWSLKRSFDTMIRDSCLYPAEAHVWVAFMLISDCVYDEKEQWWDRDPATSRLAKHALAYKFWCHQTGRGLIFDKAKIDKLKWWAESTDKKTGKAFSDFVDSINEHHEELDQACEAIYDGSKFGKEEEFPA